jgi:hypothetical protein
MQFRQIGACMQRKYAFIGIQRAIGRANDVIEEGRPMSVNGRFCCRNRHTDGAGRLVHFLKPSIVTRWIVRATYARLY